MNYYLRLIVLAGVLALPTSVLAQLPQLPRKKLSAQQLQTLKLRDDAVQKTMADFNQKLEPELKKQPQYAQMMRDLERLRTLTDPAQRKAEVAKYQATYRPVMQASLGAARLDMNKLARDLEDADPDYKFDISPNFSIKRVVKAPTKRQPIRMQLSPSPQVETVKLADFKKSHQETGAAANPGEHNFGSNHQEASARIGLSSICEVEAEQELEYTVPADVKKATLVVKCNFANSAFAVGVLGASASCSAYSELTVSGAGADISEHINASAISLPLWTTCVDASKEVEETAELRPSGKVKVTFFTRSKALGLFPSYVDAKASILQISVEVRLER
jgi:hypothetical protein